MRFAEESWIWYTFAVGIILTRLISRTLLFGSPIRLQFDDWIMGLFVTTCFTVLIVMSNVEARSQSNLLPPGFDLATLSPESIKDRQRGSKSVIIVEQMQIAVVWACKACLLILYHRLTQSVASKSNLAIKILAVYVGAGFFIMEILYFAAWCRPFSQYWAVPPKSSQCNALTNHRITNAVFNISSDLIMLCIALSLFIRSLLPLKRKLILCGIFSFGIFAIVAAVLNKYFSFTRPYASTWIFWYCRESSTAIIVANLPFTWTLLRKVFNLGAFDENHPPPPTYHSSRTAGGRRVARAHHTHGTALSNEKHSNSHQSQNSHSMSLIGSIGAGNAEPSVTITDESQRISNDLLEEGIQPTHFATGLSDIDLERGTLGPGLPNARISFHPHTPTRPSTPTPHTKHDIRGRLSPDGTGGFLTSPRRAHLAPSSVQAGSRASSRASSIRRPTSPTPTHLSASTTDGAWIRPPTAYGGGGRSATDRKKRARMSN